MKEQQPSAVTMIGSLPPHRGVSPYVLDLCSALAVRDDVDLDVVAFRSLYPRVLYPGGDPADSSAASAKVPSAVTRRPIRWWNPLGWLLAGLTLRGDVVHAQWWSYPLAPVYVALLACARLRRKTVIITMHNVEPHEGGLLRRLANRAVTPFAHRIIVHTAENARTLRRTMGDVRPIDVIPIGVRTAEMEGGQADRERARRRLGIAGDAPAALFFGNIRSYKGVPLLLRAFEGVRATLPAARLIVAGQPWGGADEIRSEITRLGLGDAVVAHLAYVAAEEIPSYFAAADVVVYPYTHFDAQSAAACVALSYGKAIVVTDTGGLPDLAGDPSVVVPAGDVDALGDAVLRVLSDASLRKSLEEHSRALASRLHWPAIAEATADVYARSRHIRAQRPMAEIELTVDRPG